MKGEQRVQVQIRYIRPMRGTLLNTACVAVGASLGLAIGRFLPAEAKTAALHGLGLVTAGVGIKMFLETKNPLIAAASVAIGGILGAVLRLQVIINQFGNYVQSLFHVQGQFSAGLVAAFVLFCVGPMTLLGCLQDGIEGKIELLSLKSTLDLISSFFLAATTGAGVLVAAALLFVFQGILTILARPMSKLAENKSAIAEATAAGGAILIATGLGLMEVKDLHPFEFIFAIVLAPVAVIVSQKFSKKEVIPCA